MLSHMLDWYDLTDDERKIRDLAFQVARDEIAPHADRHDADGTFVRESIEALGKSGLLGVFVSKEYGGLGGTPLAATLAIEVVSAACGSTGMSFMFHCNLIHVVDGAGPESLKEKYFPRFAEGQLGAFAINEQRRLFREKFDTVAADNGDELHPQRREALCHLGGRGRRLHRPVPERGLAEPDPRHGPALHPDRGRLPRRRRVDIRPDGPARREQRRRYKFKDVTVRKENAVGAEPDPMVRSVATKGNSVFYPTSSRWAAPARRSRRRSPMPARAAVNSG